MHMNLALAFVADTLLVRPVDVPAPWYSVATGILSIIVTVLLLGIAIALLGMARAVKHAEHRLGGRLQGLADELIPLAKNVNQIAGQVSEVMTSARGDIARLSGTIGAVDDAVRDALDASQARLHQFGVMLDAVQDEAQSTVASATGMMRGMRTGAGALVRNLFRSKESRSDPAARARTGVGARERAALLDESDVIARIAALEAALASTGTEEDDNDMDDVIPRGRSWGARDEGARDESTDHDDDEYDEEWDENEDEDEDDDEDDDRDDEDDDRDDEDDGATDDDDDDEDDDDDDDDDDELDDELDDDDEADADDGLVDEQDDATGGDVEPRHGGPRIRRRGRA